MRNITMPSMTDSLTGAMLGAVGLEALLAILLAVRGDGPGAVAVLALTCFFYWFVCRQRIAVVGAPSAAGAAALVLLLCGLTDCAAGHPYYGVLFFIGAAMPGFVVVLLRQGGVPAEIRVGGIVATGGASRAAWRRMLEELRDAGLLTEDEFAAKQALLAL